MHWWWGDRCTGCGVCLVGSMMLVHVVRVSAAALVPNQSLLMLLLLLLRSLFFFDNK